METTLVTPSGASAEPADGAVVEAAAECRRLTPWLVGPVLFAASSIAWFEEYGTHGLAGALLRNAVVWLVGAGGLAVVTSRVAASLVGTLDPAPGRIGIAPGEPSTRD